MPGWYPDPSGAQGQFRYWDGRKWSSATTTNPAATPPPASQPAEFEKDERRNPWVPLLIALLVLTLPIGGFLWWRSSNGSGLAAEDNNTSTPSISAWDETGTPTPEPSGSDVPDDSGGAMVSCPTQGGELHRNEGDMITGGGLAFKRVDGWDDASNFSMPWTHDMGAQTSTVYPGWFSLVSVGALSVADGFEQPKFSTQMMMSCFASSGYYRGFSGRRDVSSKPVEINGHQGWHLTSEIYVEMPSLPQVKGDVVDVVVVDLGSPESLGVFVSSYTIDDAGREAQVKEAIASLTTS